MSAPDYRVLLAQRGPGLRPGERRAARASLAGMIRAYGGGSGTEQLVAGLYEMALDRTRDDATRLAATRMLLAYGHGNPATILHVEASVAGDAGERALAHLDDAQLAAMVAAGEQVAGLLEARNGEPLGDVEGT